MKRIARLLMCLAVLVGCDGFITPDMIIMPDNKDEGTEKPEPKPEPEPKPDPELDAIPKTGDNSKIGLSLVLFVTSAVLLVVLNRKWKAV